VRQIVGKRSTSVEQPRRLRKCRCGLALLGIAAMAAPAPIPAQRTDLAIHDPSTVVKADKTYWVFGTGRGCPAFSSTDRVHWTYRGAVLPTPPAWIPEAVPGNTNGSLWAPDVLRVGGKYLLYYSASRFGSNVSAIGLATSPSPAPGGWTDQGVVVRSETRDNFNAIDPAITRSEDGRLWLTFGSFWSGIKLIELDPRTGKRLAPAVPPIALAAHPQEANDAIEAPYIRFHQGYYYLFVNWDYCCRGPRSTYNIRVGRSPRITGPYLDQAGVDMRQGGGTLVLGSPPEAAPSKPAPNEGIGPGHAGILTDEGVDRFSFHYEAVPGGGGRSRLVIGTVTWGRDGWPKVNLPKPETEPPTVILPPKQL
jgi:arabinan endo-1,5-alpha-L-arabinosidase